MAFFKHLLIKKNLLNNNAFIWNSEKKTINPIQKINTINLDLIVCIERQKKTLLENTRNFSIGNFTNNALLWGTRGNGKSTLIKSIFTTLSSEYNNLRLIQLNSIFVTLSSEYNNLRLIQLNKNNIFDIEQIYKLISKFSQMRFIIFIDDLSFEKIDSDYKIIKSTLDGSIQNQPTNIVLYITSNRRHLMPRDMIDNERSSAIHTDESVEEKISLSDRFGLWIGFHNLSQIEYLKIVKSYCNYYEIKCDK
ncbi:uncharacterized protein METZ01_LOCUS374947, partial [marine metagenome]